MPASSGGIGYGDLGGTIQNFFRIENVVDFGVLHQPVGVDARFCHVEALSDKRRHGRDVVAELVPVVFRDLGDDRRVHAVEGAAQGGIFDDHRLKRDVAGPLADAEQGAIDGGGAVKPCGGGVDDGLVEIVVSVPFKHFRGDVGIVVQPVYDAGDAARQGDAGIRHAITHRIAHADLDGDPRFSRKLRQLVDKGNDEAVESGA